MSNEPNAATQRGRILAFLRNRGKRGATDEEIQHFCDLSGNTERPRRQELERMGLVYYTEHRRENESGRWYAYKEGELKWQTSNSPR